MCFSVDVTVEIENKKCVFFIHFSQLYLLTLIVKMTIWKSYPGTEITHHNLIWFILLKAWIYFIVYGHLHWFLVIYRSFLIFCQRSSRNHLIILQRLIGRFQLNFLHAACSPPAFWLNQNCLGLYSKYLKVFITFSSTSLDFGWFLCHK